MDGIKLDIIVNNNYHLYLPAEGVDLELLRNDFNLLTTDIAAARPLYTTESFLLPLDGNQQIFDEIGDADMNAQLLYNDVVIMTGKLIKYSPDEQKRNINVSIVSQFKDMVNVMGDNVLYLDAINFDSYNHRVVYPFGSSMSNDLLKYGYYNPMDTNTGQITFEQGNIDDYCKPSLNVVNYFKKLFAQHGWSANWDDLPPTLKQVCLLPTTQYQCSSLGLDWTSTNFYIKANTTTELIYSWKYKWVISYLVGSGESQMEIRGGSVNIDTGGITIKYPARLSAFKLKVTQDCPDPFEIVMKEGDNELAHLYLYGDEVASYITDNFNLKEGFDPIHIYLVNPNNYDLTIPNLYILFYNLFSIYETNQDTYFVPENSMMTIAEAFPKITPLELYRNFMTLFQLAQSTNDQTKEVNFYFINDVYKQAFDRVDLNKYIFWNGYETLGDKIEGLAKINTIRYKDDAIRQRYFKVNLPNLASNNIYYESIFAHAESNNVWLSEVMPALRYKVKLVDGISKEYLEWQGCDPLIGLYDNAAYDERYVFWTESCPFGKIHSQQGGISYAKIDNTVYPYDITTRNGGLILITVNPADLSVINVNVFTLYFDQIQIDAACDFIRDTPNNAIVIGFMLDSLYANGDITQLLAFIEQCGVTAPREAFTIDHTAFAFFGIKGRPNSGISKFTMQGDNAAARNAYTNPLYLYTYYNKNNNAFEFLRLPMTFQKIHISNVVGEYWNDILKFISSELSKNPVAYKIKMRVTYYDYITKFQQRNLFFYTDNAIMIEGSYNVLDQTLTGTFISVK